MMEDREEHWVEGRRMTTSNGTRTSKQVLQAVVKLFVQSAMPNYCMPWQIQKQQQSFGSGFVIEGRRILTNAHVIKYQKSIRVRKHGDAKKYQAHIIHVAHDCDIAMISVEDDKFWEDINHLELGSIPMLEEDVVVVGFPTGGDNISVTRGVVSRVDLRRYSHSGQDLLAIQIDAAINAGNSGGPALQDGNVVGVAYQVMSSAENIGYIIPVPVIHHFLEDIETHNSFSGYCDLGVRWQAIEADQMRSYFQLAQDDTGVLVAKVLKLSCSHKYLKKGDILMSVDGHPIADNGTVLFRGDERISWSYILHSKFPGQTIKALVLRAGEKLEIEVKLDAYKPLVPRQLYDKTPSYVVYCGLVFVVLSLPYLNHQFGNSWVSRSYRLAGHVHSFAERAEQEVVLLSQVLASELTAGYEAFSNLQLYKVNGIPVLNLRHLCFLLDMFTQSHVEIDSDENGLANDLSNGDSYNEKETESRPGSEVKPQINQVSMQDFEAVVNVSRHTDKIGPDVQMSSALCDTGLITSFKDIENDYKIETSVKNVNLISSERTRKRNFKGNFSCYTDADKELFNEFTRESPSLYAQLMDESLLLDCENFINFELDQNRIIVLNINDAKKKSNDILRHHAITNPRSLDLPSSLSFN